MPSFVPLVSLGLVAFLLLRSPLVGSAYAEETVFHAEFEEASLPAFWKNEGTGRATLEEMGGLSHVLHVSLAETSTHLVSIPLPVEQLRGLRVSISARVKAEQVSKPAEPWNGVKLMLYTNSPSGPKYQGAMDLYGTFDWKECGLAAVVPLDATEATLMLGLQNSKGDVWFDDARVAVSAKPRKRPATQSTLLPPEQLDRRTEVPRLRGVMYGPEGKAEDLKKLAEWGGNLIRWQFYWYDGSFPEKRLDLALYDHWLEKTMAGLDELLPLCEKLGIRVIIDLHTPPGGVASGQSAIFQDKAYQQKFIEIWDRLAAHYKDKPAVWAYDLLNEPAEGNVAEGLHDWRRLAEVVAKRVREIDARHAIIVEPGPFGGWENLPYFEPIAVPGIIYSVHVYEPLALTHQGVLEGYPIGPEYPGVIDGVLWNKDKLRQILEPVREYQKDYNVPIFIGEFSAIRWAPGDSAARYLRDCIEIFEEYGWDWAYHAFREWNGWNVEVGSTKDDPTPAKDPTTREKVLREGLGKNAAQP